ncbi:MAG: hypothetical protein V1922_04235 [bacterium]
MTKKSEVIVQSTITVVFVNVVADVVFNLFLNIFRFVHFVIPWLHEVYKYYNILIRLILFSVTIVVAYIYLRIKKDDDTVKEIKEIRF